MAVFYVADGGGCARGRHVLCTGVADGLHVTEPACRHRTCVRARWRGATGRDRAAGDHAHDRRGVVDRARRRLRAGRCRRGLLGLPGGDRAVSQHGARLRVERQVVVRVPRCEGPRMGRRGRGGCRLVRGVAAGPGRQRDRDRRCRCAAQRGHREPSLGRGVQLLRLPRPLRCRRGRRVGGVATGGTRRLQAVLAPRDQGPSGPYPARPAPGHPPPPAHPQRRAGGRAPRGMRAPPGQVLAGGVV